MLLKTAEEAFFFSPFLLWSDNIETKKKIETEKKNQTTPSPPPKKKKQKETEQLFVQR